MNTTKLESHGAVAGQVERGVRPRAWLCELAQEDGTTRTQIVEQDPDGLRWNDAGEPSPYRTTPLYEAPPWVPVTERLPAAGRKVLVCYRNSYGRLRRTCAHYSPLHTVDASTWDEGMPDETEDGSFEPEGWWEEPVEMERVEFIADEVTHWMPLPEPPPLPVAGPNDRIEAGTTSRTKG